VAFQLPDDPLNPQIGEPGLPDEFSYPMRHPDAWPVQPITNPLENALWPSVDIPPPGAPRPQEHPIGPWKEGQTPSWPGNMPTPKDQVPFDTGKHFPKHERYMDVDAVIDGEPFWHRNNMDISEQHQRIKDGTDPPFGTPPKPPRKLPPLGQLPPRNQG